MPIRKVGKKWAVVKKIHRVFPTKGAAMRFEAQHSAAIAKVEQLGPTEKTCCTIRDKLEEFLADRVEGTDVRSCNEQTAELNRRRLLAFDRAFHSRPLDHIAMADVNAWRRRRRKGCRGRDGVGRGTVNAEIGILKAFARWAQAQEYAPQGLPLLAVPRSRVGGTIPGTNRKPPEIMDIDPALDLVARIKKERPDAGLFLEGMIFFMRRPEAVAGLRRRDVRLPVRDRPGSVFFRPLKGFHEVTLSIPAGSLAHEWARACVEMADREGVGENGPFVVCCGGRSRRNPGGWTTGSLDMVIARLCDKFGDLPRGFRPYVLRHTLISWLQDQADITVAAVQAAASHSKPTTQAAYSHRKAVQARPAFAAIEAFLRRRKQTTR